MNEQKAPGGIEWTRIREDDDTVRRGYTWNPVAGCMHGCRWLMPNGEVAICYAEEIAEKVAASAYPHGFAHHYWNPDRLEEPLKVSVPAGIFLDSMSDLMGAWVPNAQIWDVLDVCARASWHTFQLLTKNAPRLLKFEFPPNVWVGVSSPPDYMFGQPLKSRQQESMLARSLDVLGQLKSAVRWMSFEPLSWDVSPIVQKYSASLDWMVIGAASSGRTHYPPSDTALTNLLRTADALKIPVFYKGNMKSSRIARQDWRDAFPEVVHG